MKNLIPLLLALIAVPVIAEPPMLIDRDTSLNYFLSLNVEFSEVGNEGAQFAGIEIGTRVDDSLSLGVGLYGLIHDVELEAQHGMEPLEEWDLWYAGGIIEYHFYPTELLDVSIECLLGGGWAELSPEAGGDGPNIDFYVFRPTVNLTWNLTETWEIGGGVGYRWMEGSDNGALTDDEAGGLVGRLFFRFNEF